MTKSETFRSVEPLGEIVGVLLRVQRGVMRINFSSRHDLTVAEARALRDWLDKALPCEHKRQIGIQPTGYVCTDCGATLP